jgi:hypothetical protein
METPRRRNNGYVALNEISMDWLGNMAAVRGEALFNSSQTLSTALEFLNSLWGLGTE